MLNIEVIIDGPRSEPAGNLDPLMATIAWAMYETPMTKETLSKRSGISETALRHWMRGVVNPRILDVAAAGEVLGFDLVWIERPITFVRHKES